MMTKFQYLSVITVTALWLCVADASACTNIIVGKKASVDGSVMVSYSIDGNLYIPPLPLAWQKTVLWE